MINHLKIPMLRDKRIALVAHDNKKWDLVQWAKYNRDLLAHHKVFATGTVKEANGKMEMTPTKIDLDK